MAVRAVERDPVAVVDRVAVLRHEPLLRVVDRDVRTASDAALAHSARDDGRVTRHSAARREDCLGRHHSVEIFRRRLDSNKDDLLAVLVQFVGFIGIEDDLSSRGAGACRQSVRDDVDRRRRVDHLVKQLVELVRLDAHERRVAIDEPLRDHVHGDLHGRLARAFRVAGLEHEQPAALDRELEVLHVAVVFLESLGDGRELLVDLGHVVPKLRDLLGSADAGDDVLALRVLQILAVKVTVARRRVAREGDSGSTILAQVPEDHRLHVDGRAERVVDAVDAPVIDGPAPVPRLENRADRQLELLHRIARETTAGLGAHDGQILLVELLEMIGRQVGVERDSGCLLLGFERVIELLAGDIEHDLPEELDESAVRVAREAFVARLRRQTLESLFVKPEVEHRVHHPGHRELRARPDRDEQRVRRIAKGPANRGFDPGERRLDLVPQSFGQRLASGVVLVAGFGSDREAGRHGEAGVRHFGKSGSLSTEQILHGSVAIGLPVAKDVDVLSGHSKFSRCVLGRLRITAETVEQGKGLQIALERVANDQKRELGEPVEVIGWRRSLGKPGGGLREYSGDGRPDCRRHTHAPTGRTGRALRRTVAGQPYVGVLGGRRIAPRTPAKVRVEAGELEHPDFEVSDERVRVGALSKRIESGGQQPVDGVARLVIRKELATEVRYIGHRGTGDHRACGLFVVRTDDFGV